MGGVMIGEEGIGCSLDGVRRGGEKGAGVGRGGVEGGGGSEVAAEGVSLLHTLRIESHSLRSQPGGEIPLASFLFGFLPPPFSPPSDWLLCSLLLLRAEITLAAVSLSAEVRSAQLARRERDPSLPTTTGPSSRVAL